MAMRFPGVILSGGKSSRMGEPKAQLPFGPARLIDHVAARLEPQVIAMALNSNSSEIALPGIVSFGDRFADFPGPLAGIHAALAYTSLAWPAASHVAVVPVDAPFFPNDLIDRLAVLLTGSTDVALTMSAGQLHPVLGLWPVSALNRLTLWLKHPPTLKVRAFLEGMPVRTANFDQIATPLGPLDPFFNVNTPEDLAHAREILKTTNSVSI